MQLIGINVLPVPIGTSAQRDVFATQFGLKYCPSMDLVAVFPQSIPDDQAVEAAATKQGSAENYYGEDDNEVLVEVYRLNGQKVFTIGIENSGSTLGVVDVAWRDDGVVLAIATSENVTRLVNSFSGKVIHTFSSTSKPPEQSSNPAEVPKSPSSKRKSASWDSGPAKRRCMPTRVHYSTHFSNPQSTAIQLNTAQEEGGVVLDDLLGFNANIEQLLRCKADLPREIANIDVEQFLPKLATLPANGMGEEDIFSSRTSIDAMFHPVKQHSSSMVNVVAVAQSDGHVHLRVFDSFEVGDIDLNQALRKRKEMRLRQAKRIVTHPLSNKIALIVEEQDQKRTSRTSHAGHETALHLLAVDLRFLRQSTFTLPVLATKATQLHNLIRYLRQIESQLAREVKAAFDLPARFMRTLEEDLNEQDGEGSTFETSAYHALLTGQVHGKFKEWLTDILGERGVKRWDKAVLDCLELTRRLINENWNPAIERAGIVVSRLSGLAAADTTFGISKRVLNALRDTVDVMAVLGEDLLRDTNAEIVGFSAFMKWLKREVEMAGLEDTSEKLDEMREANDHSEVRKVMRYISKRLHATSVKRYIGEGEPIGKGEAEEDDLLFYENFKKARTASQERGLQRIPSMKSLVERLSIQCGRLFQQVASKLREGVRLEYVCELPDDFGSDILAAACLQGSDKGISNTADDEPELCVRLAAGLKTENQSAQPASIKKCDLALDVSKIPKVGSRDTYQIQGTAKILDVKMVDEDEAMVLAASSTDTKIVTVNLDTGKRQTVRHRFGGPSDDFTKAGLVPWKLEVNSRKGRRTVTVLDEQGRGYGVFDLDSSSNVQDDVDEVMSR